MLAGGGGGGGGGGSVRGWRAAASGDGSAAVSRVVGEGNAHNAKPMRAVKAGAVKAGTAGTAAEAADAAEAREQDDDDDADAEGAAGGEAARKKRVPSTFNTGILMKVPNVAPAKDIVQSALKRASRVTPTKGLKDPTLKERNRSAKQLDALTTNLCKPLGEYVKGFPRLERLHPFERALLELTLRDGHYDATLHQVDLLRKGMLGIGKGFTSRAAKATGPQRAIAIREEAFKEMESYYNGRSQCVDDLKEIAKTLRRLPVAELSTPTVALVGAPNVGKSSLVRVLSSGTPEVQNYPFTTRGIKMGHFFIEERRHVVTDTPGLLWRPDTDRNKIERLALATLEHLPTCVVFVTDLTGLCGTSVEDQMSIRADLHSRFAGRRPWLDVMSKSALVPALGGELSPDIGELFTAADEEEALHVVDMLTREGALAVSAGEDVGGERLKGLITEVLIKHRDTLEDSDTFKAYDPGF
mmetsp:Transcript_28622/g.70572  ORF Transcript_28622/g.70572 Transcript_28622/m.70572 type:complete len:470 (-) Transcript_28622:243-1652(-)